MLSTCVAQPSEEITHLMNYRLNIFLPNEVLASSRLLELVFFCLSCIAAQNSLSAWCQMKQPSLWGLSLKTYCLFHLGGRRRNFGGHHSIETFVLRSQSSIWVAEDVQ